MCHESFPFRLAHGLILSQVQRNKNTPECDILFENYALIFAVQRWHQLL
jgi:hypothetical protein